MSAAEKLKALNGGMTQAPWYVDESGDDLFIDDDEGIPWPLGFAGDNAKVADLRNALPQIIAVVEAMHETCYAPTFGAVDEAGRIWKRDELQMLAIDKGRHALAALDEALS